MLLATLGVMALPAPSQPVPAVPAPPGRPRRRWLVVSLVLLLGLPLLLVVAGAVTALLYVTDRVDTVGGVGFDRPLRVPPLAASTVDADGTRVFDLRLQAGRTDLTGRGPTGTWGVGGAHLGPTLRLARGEQVRMEVTNDLPEASNLHWHGVHLPAEADGGPHTMVEPGGRWTPGWTVDQPAATAWYHPHGHGTTADHVRRGVYGMLLVDDPASAPEGLPDRYGVDDVPVMVQDAVLTRGGGVRAGGLVPMPVGPLGDQVLVNGTVGPYLDVVTEAVRLRLLNTSASRVYDFVLSDGRQMDLVGTDGGLLPAPVPLTSVPLSPGERAEVVVRVRPGEEVVLRSQAPDLGVAGLMVGMSGAGDRFDVLELRAADRLEPSPALPPTLAAAPALEASGDAPGKTFVLSDNEINGTTMDMSRVDQVTRTGATERWTVRNDGGMPHSFHLHGTSFAVASVDGDAPPERLAGWKDTVLVPPEGTLELLVRFDGAGDPDTPYMFHCHLLAHHDQGMMGQLLVVDPGQEPATSLAHDARAASVAQVFPGAVRGHGHP